MSAAELIEQLKALPPSERETFARLFRAMVEPRAPVEGNGKGQLTSNPGNWPDFTERLKHIYGSKLVADSQAVISFARGDW